MRPSMRCGLVALAAVLCGAMPAHAQAPSPQLVETQRDWSVYTVEDGAGLTCYAASEPTKQDGNFSKRSSPAVMIARRPGRSAGEEVSVQPGYSYKPDSDVEVSIDGRRFALFTQNDASTRDGHAWTRTEAEDKVLIEAMRSGSTMTVRGTSTRGTFSLDTYSLNGFTAAVAALRNACSG